MLPPKSRQGVLALGALSLVLAALAPGQDAPDGIERTRFSGPDLTPSPACLAVAATGEVFVGVDAIGSLGKQAGKGRVVRLVDTDHDGVADEHTVFATLDNPRGLLPVGDELFVLHTSFGPSDVAREAGSEGAEPPLVATGMDLVAYTDADRDGIADGPPRMLLHNLSTTKFVRDRGTDHATNGIRMGIDGWIYIAVGDFGFHGAIDAEGRSHTMLGGGVLRLRPDGTEVELYTHGLRNIYDVAIDPFLNVFTRGNTNDGGGWNIRFIHHLQTGEYGYPVLFKHFTHQALPALADLGGGSGTGALFLDDARWPDWINGTPLMADWGKSQLFAHHVQPDGPSFTQTEEPFLDIPQITDVDLDASGVMYLAAWDGAGYWGDPTKGHVVRAVPAGFEHRPHPRVQDLSIEDLATLLRATGAAARLDASQELVRRASAEASRAAHAVLIDPAATRATRVAALFTFAQLAGAEAIPTLVELTTDASLAEFALRALADRRAHFDAVPTAPFLVALAHADPRVRSAAIIGLGRLSGRTAFVAPPGSTTVQLRTAPHPDHDAVAAALLATPPPAGLDWPPAGTEGPHATPNPGLVHPHLAARALINMRAVDACLDAIATDAPGPTHLALWVLSHLHEDAAVDGLMAAYDWHITSPEAGSPAGDELEQDLLVALARLYHREAAYDGSWWWNTRPDTHGPYYKAEEWSSSFLIGLFLGDAWEAGDEARRELLMTLNERMRLGIEAFERPPVAELTADELVDLAAIAARTGEVAELSVEDALIGIKDLAGEVELGRALFTKQGCVACHALSADEPPKGPFMGHVGSVLDREAIAMSILRPDASISQGFATTQVTTKDATHIGFVTAESATEVELRDITGRTTKLQVDAILERDELDGSMMPVGLANSLSLEAFAALVDFLADQTE
ncbi:MAG: heme-binding protein [Planctomycetota bacterium]|nr:heme-binding protein [Planctomycetota bacterium]